MYLAGQSTIFQKQSSFLSSHEQFLSSVYLQYLISTSLLFIDRFPEIVKVREENDCTTKVNNDNKNDETTNALFYFDPQG